MSKKHGQMSEALPTGIFLTLSGGFQDAYTYFCRGKVFANAQTGNIIMMGHNLASGQWQQAIRYLAPIAAFGCGIYLAEHIRSLYQHHIHMHWRQIVVLIEILLLFAVGWMPQSMNLWANILVSLVCAMQVESFRKMNGNVYATTMCIGNLRSAAEHFYTYMHNKDIQVLKKSMQYYVVIMIFAVGAVFGSRLSAVLGEKTIWVSCLLLTVSFGIMFIKEDIEGIPEAG